jgi:hypothetical protein
LRGVSPSCSPLCCVVGRARVSLPGLCTGTKARIFSFWYQNGIILRQGKRCCCIDRSRFCMCACGGRTNRNWEVARFAGRAVAILDQSAVVTGGGFGFDFGRGLAVSTKRVRIRDQRLVTLSPLNRYPRNVAIQLHEVSDGALSGFVAGSFTWSSRPPAFARQVARSHRGSVRFTLGSPSFSGVGSRPAVLVTVCYAVDVFTDFKRFILILGVLVCVGMTL